MSNVVIGSFLQKNYTTFFETIGRRKNESRIIQTRNN